MITCNKCGCDTSDNQCCNGCSSDICGACCRTCEQCGCQACDECFDESSQCCDECFGRSHKSDVGSLITFSDIDKIAESITEDPNVLLEADPTRRDFLKRSASAVSAAKNIASGNIPGMVGSLGKMAGLDIPGMSEPSGPDPFAHISDEELTETPEGEWIFAIPYSRLLRIMSNCGEERTHEFTGDYANKEIGNKIYSLANYLAGGTPLSSMSNYNETLKIINRMKKAAQEAEVFDPSIIMANLGDQLRYYFQSNNEEHVGIRAIHAIKKICKESGLEIPKEIVVDTVNDARHAAERWERKLAQRDAELSAKKNQKLKGKAKTPKSGIEKGRTLSKSGETGGLPPLQPRSITRRQRDFPYKDASLTSKAESPYPTFESKLSKALIEELENINTTTTTDDNRQMQDQLKKQQEMQRKRDQERERRLQPQFQKLQTSINNVNNNVQRGIKTASETHDTFDELDDSIEDMSQTLDGLEKEF